MNTLCNLSQIFSDYLMPLYLRSAQECVVRHPGPAALGYFSAFTEHSAQTIPAEALPGGWIMPSSLCSSVLFLCWCQPTQSPPSPPHPHGKTCRAEHPRWEEGASLIHPSTKGIGQAHNHWLCFHRCRAKSQDLCAPGQLCWHRQSWGNVRHLKTEQMFLLKGLPQCSA